MKYREYELYPYAQLADSGTERVDINVVDWITEMAIEFRVLNESGAVASDAPPVSVISKIEIVDGGEVYWSCTGHEALAAYVYDAGKYPYRGLYEQVSTGQTDMIPIRFGRWLADPEFGFDPKRLKNPQLVVTWTDSASHQANGTYMAVHTKLVEDVPAPGQMLTWETIKTFTSAADGDEPVKLPNERPIRTLMVRIAPVITVMLTAISNYELDCDYGKFKAFDLNNYDFARLMPEWWPEVRFKKKDICDDADRRQLWMGGLPGLNVYTPSAGYIVGASDAEVHFYTARCRLYDNTPATAMGVNVEVIGHGPENTMAYPFGKRNEPNTWFPARDYENIRLLLTQGYAGNVVSTVLETPRAIP